MIFRFMIFLIYDSDLPLKSEIVNPKSKISLFIFPVAVLILQSATTWTRIIPLPTFGPTFTGSCRTCSRPAAAA